MLRRMMKRRDALKTIGGLAGAASLAKLLPGCGDGGEGPDHPEWKNRPPGITHYVYLMLENRSYDHVLGARALEGLGGDGLRAGMTNPDRNGAAVPLYVPSDLDMCTMHDPAHGWETSRQQWNNGANDGFLRVHPPGALDPLQYLTRDQMPVSWALADAYTSCDRWFCSVMGPTLPNRAYWHVGTSLGLKVNGDVLTAFSNGVPVPTLYNRLNDNGIDWAYYYGNLAVVSLLGQEGPYRVDLGPNDGTGHIRRFGDALVNGGTFFEDCANGTLPPVTYIDPAFFENDDHPPVHPILGQELLAAVYTALATSPLWPNIMLVVTYDEHGGFFDHVSPPKAADDTMARFGVEGFDQLGFRVPTLAIGPYAKQGHVSSVQYDHTSALKQLSNHFGFDTLTARMDAANDLSDCIDQDRLAAGDWARPAPIPMVDRYAWPTTDARCTTDESFRYGDPISEWADANPGGFKPEFDIRGQTKDHAMIRDFVRRHRDLWKVRGGL